MIAAIEALVLLLVLLAAVLLYRRLIHSSRFARLVADVTRPSPESDEEILKDLQTAERSAWNRAEQNKQVATKKREAAAKIQRRVRRNPN